MDLTSLYDLKERIENAVFSGTSLLHDDFKLKKAYENFLPLSELNPVFGKIKAGMEGVYSADKDNMNEKLLDTLPVGGGQGGRRNQDSRAGKRASGKIHRNPPLARPEKTSQVQVHDLHG